MPIDKTRQVLTVENSWKVANLYPLVCALDPDLSVELYGKIVDEHKFLDLVCEKIYGEKAEEFRKGDGWTEKNYGLLYMVLHNQLDLKIKDLGRRAEL